MTVTTLTTHLTKRTVFAGLVGIITSLVLSFNLGLFSLSGVFGYGDPVLTEDTEGVHVHADFLMYLGDTRIRFSEKKYQSAVGHTLDAAQHFHDGNDEVIHRHSDNVTLVDFFHSLNITLTDPCLMMNDHIMRCTDRSNELMLFVNGNRTTDIIHYVIAEKDRIFLYYGDPNNPHLSDYMNSVTDQACLYSRTCPERGEPPTENCGLTCNITDLFR